MAKKDFNVAIMHGHYALDIITGYVEELGYTPRILKEEYEADTVLKRFRKLIWDHVHCVIVLLTADDKTDDQKFRARQNVVFELGYCFGAFDSIEDNASYKAENALILIEEEGLELFADITGITTIKFKRGELEKQKSIICRALENSYNKAKVFYDL